ncbi:MAG: DUF1674 domain-containing protein [Defluviicoccus sp.]|nr:MAG: DUF1674 domain-containing protein [Defluviicoccus sp.]
MSESVHPNRPADGKAKAELVPPQPDASDASSVDKTAAEPASAQPSADLTEELGGPKGPEPTRFGDWERKGRCIDF